MDENTVLKRSSGVTFQTVADEAILIHMNTGTYFSLNQVGTDFWELLNGEQNIIEHAETIAQKYNGRTKLYVASLAELVDQFGDKSMNDHLTNLAVEYDLDEETVQEHYENIMTGETEEEIATIESDYLVDAEMVMGDLIEIAEEMGAEDLVEALA